MTYKISSLREPLKFLVPVLFNNSLQKSFSSITLLDNPIRNSRELHLFNGDLLNRNALIITENRYITKFISNVAKENNEIKTKLIRELNFKTDEDALPFYKLPIKTLLKIYKTTKHDEKSGFCKNRLYYISDQIKCQPSVLSQHIVRRTFIYSLSFHWLQSSLNILLEMDVSGDRILRDLWVLKYNHKTILARLERVKNLGVDVLYPWMVRCSEDILNRSITIAQETKSILGDNKSTKMYVASRLNISPEVIEDMYTKIPALKTTRAVKVKNFLDFLLEQGFSVEEITNKARILTASQKTVKQRLNKLRTLGLSEINLNVLCRSRKDFKKYCESIESIGKGL